MINELADEHFFSPEASVPGGMVNANIELIQCDAGPLYMPAEDEVMRDYISNRRTWEPEIGRYILGVLRGARRPVFVDVGANVGYFSCLVCGHVPAASVHAFEPHPRLVPILSLNAWMSGGRIKAWPLALSSADRSVVLESSVHNIGDTRSARPTQGEVVNMLAPAIAFDDLFPKGRVDVVKIDVQGSEHLVVEGMVKALRRSPNVHVVVEFGLQMFDSSGIQPMSVLGAYRHMGFEVYWLHRDGLRSESDAELVRAARSAGPSGQLNLILRWKQVGR